MKTSYFMADFAATDRRSVRAHLNGTSMRAVGFSLFHVAEKALGRSDRASHDYMLLSRYVFSRREMVARVGRGFGYAVTSVAGLIAGGALYLYLVQ